MDAGFPFTLPLGRWVLAAMGQAPSNTVMNEAGYEKGLNHNLIWIRMIDQLRVVETNDDQRQYGQSEFNAMKPMEGARSANVIFMTKHTE